MLNRDVRVIPALQYKPGNKLEVFENGNWKPCVLIKIATYVGRGGPGYDAAYDPPNERCASFWCNDPVLRQRHV